MIKSMTGYGRGESKNSDIQFIVEIKSVNHRYNDIIVKMPKRFTYLEEKIKDAIKDEVKRGRVEVFVSFENVGEGDTQIALNLPLATQYYECLCQIRNTFEVRDDISVSLISKLPEIFKVASKKEDEDQIWNCMEEAVKNAVEMLVNMRASEGNRLAEDILSRSKCIEDIVIHIEKRAPEVVTEYKTKLRDRINEMLEGAAQIDESRLSMEIAIYADKSSITEEIVRLKSHILQLRKSLKENQPIGRKLDFLIQEMNREVNTIGSKSNDLEMINHVVDIKSELEKIREQIQNIE